MLSYILSSINQITGENLKHLFNDDPNVIYLNSGTQSKPPIEIIKKAEEYRQIGQKGPVELHLMFPRKIYQAHIEFSQFINCDPNDLFFSHNVTESLNNFISGTTLPKEAEIIIPDIEYGATLNICRSKSENENHKLTILPLAHLFEMENKTSQILNEEIINIFKELTLSPNSMVILSHVLTGNGAILPIEEIGKVLHSKNCMLVVDGAHALAAFPINFGDYHHRN